MNLHQAYRGGYEGQRQKMLRQAELEQLRGQGRDGV